VQVALLATPQPASVFLLCESFSKPEHAGFQTLGVWLVVFKRKVFCKKILQPRASLHLQQLTLAQRLIAARCEGKCAKKLGKKFPLFR
jgi:hypothetical protein